MTLTTSNIILIIDDEQLVRDLLIRVLASSFPTYAFATAKDVIEGIARVEQYADQLRLVILDIQLPRLDGRVAATVIRELVPRVPVMPFSRHEDMFPIMEELGCVEPVLKQAHAMRQMSSAEWIRMAQAQARLTLGETRAAPEATATNDGMVQLPRANVIRVRDLLDKYLRRFPTPAREIIQARSVLLEDIRD